jgi:hypothetical protein
MERVLVVTRGACKALIAICPRWLLCVPRVFPRKPAPYLIRGGYRFAEEKRANKREESELPIQPIGISLLKAALERDLDRIPIR